MSAESCSARPYEILLVEDNPGDVRLAKEALCESVIEKRIHVAEDGVTAIEMLRERGTCAGQGWPDLILLDLNLPKRSGHEVLAEVRGDPGLCQAPVIVFTSSAAEQDVRRAYELHANCYVTKPAGFEELRTVIRRIESFWLGTVRLPTRCS